MAEYSIKNIERLSLRERLKLIYRYEFEGQESLKSAVLRIQANSSLTPKELSVLSWTFHHAGKDVDDYPLTEEGKMTSEEFSEIMNSLMEKGLVYWFVDFKGPESAPEEFYEVDIKAVDHYRDSHYRDIKNETPKCPTYTHEELFEYMGKQVKANNGSALVNCVEQALKINHHLIFSQGYFDIVENNKLQDDEKALLLALSDSFVKRGTSPFCVEHVSWESDYIKKWTNKLVEKGLAIVVPEVSSLDGRDDDSKDRFLLSPNVCRALFRGTDNLINYASLSHQADIVKCEDIVEKELFYDDDNIEKVKSLYKIVEDRMFLGIVNRLEAKGRRKGIAYLLYGAPGTGKTELAKQLARSSGRDLLIADASKINGSYWGESEKNVREMFRNFLYLHAISEKAPIFLFNEADGILAKRQETRSAIGRVENVVQSILLQEMESFEGIFIATTNLEKNIDAAFYRRFIFKIEFNTPTAKTRARIWMSEIPELTEEEAIEYAERFDLSGGQIDNISMRRDIHEAINGKAPTHEQMLSFCKEEEMCGKDNSTRVRIIGFQTQNKNNADHLS